MDIDIDVASTTSLTATFNGLRASMVHQQELKPHPVGIYFQNMPKDGVTGLAAIPYKEAEAYGFIKIDFLHLLLLDYFDCKEDIRKLMRCRPNWKLFHHRKHVEKMFQLHNHFDMVNQILPTSTLELADVIALIRPSKRHLVRAYGVNRQLIRRELYRKVNGVYFKKSHSIAYAKNIELQMLLIDAGII